MCVFLSARVCLGLMKAVFPRHTDGQCRREGGVSARICKNCKSDVQSCKSHKSPKQLQQSFAHENSSSVNVFLGHRW